VRKAHPCVAGWIGASFGRFAETCRHVDRGVGVADLLILKCLESKADKCGMAIFENHGHSSEQISRKFKG